MSRIKRRAKEGIRDSLDSLNKTMVSTLSSKKNYRANEVTDNAKFDEVFRLDFENFNNYNQLKQAKVLKLYLKFRDAALSHAIKVLKK